MRFTLNNAELSRKGLTLSTGGSTSILPNAGIIPLGGININANPIAKIDLEHAKIVAGAQVVRCEEQTTNKASLKEVAVWCAELGLKLCWITNLLEPKEKNETSKKTLIEQIGELTVPQRETIILIEHGNEEWPGGSAAVFKLTGKQMAGWFCTIAEEFATAKIPVPLGLQVQLNPVGETVAWTEEIGTISHATLKKALEPTAILSTGNWIVVHPYGSKMTLSEVNQNNIKENSEAYLHGGAEEDPVPGGGKKWSSQRWMKCQYLMKEWTGLTVPVALTEFGVRTENEVGEEPFWKVASAAIEAEYIKAYYEFCHEVHIGKVAATPPGLTPVLGVAIWYDQYRASKTESYGIMSPAGVPFEPCCSAFAAGVAAI